MLTSRSGPAVGLIGLVVLLAALQATVGLSLLGWVVGSVCGVVLAAAIARGLARHGAGLGPADLVTLTRATLACGLAALVTDAFVREPPTAVVVALAIAALVLDALDGWVARRTRTTSTFGARFDGEVDAFLIAVLSVYVARSFGWWVLALGAARYVFAIAGWGLPWLRSQLPYRYWRKVVTAAAGIVLAVGAADVLPRPLTIVALAAGVALMAESFGRDVWWLWRHRSSRPADAVPSPADAGIETDDRPPRHRRVRRPVLAALLNVAALLLVWFALVAPNQSYRLTPGAFLRIPVEGLVVAGLALVLPSWARRIVAVVVGVLLGLLTVVKLLDMGFFVAFDRPFDLATDGGYLGSAIDLAKDSIGGTGATIVVIAAAALLVVVLVGMPLSVTRLTSLVARHRSRSARACAMLVVLCLAFGATGLRVGPGEPVTSLSASHLAIDHVEAVASDVEEQQEFDAAAATDRFRDETSGGLLSGLRGKDVLVVFVESYGRVALEGSPSSRQLRAMLDSSADRLGAAGYSSASAFLTSPTFGGLSWLAHGTLQSGLWVDNQQRYDELLAGNRLTLTRAFGEAGWRTVALLPSNKRKWPRGQHFYKYDKIYDRRDVGYRGPRFGFSKMPDQYALAAFERLELGKRGRAPVMAEIDLASSHTPWAKIPRLVPWNKLGDGSIFNRVQGQQMTVGELWSDADDVKAAYARSLAYSLQAVISFVQRSHDRDLAVVLLGDHQPGTVVSGHGGSRDVPVTIIAGRGDIERIADWGWQDGMSPDPKAPVWRMDAFRDRFFAAYSR